MIFDGAAQDVEFFELCRDVMACSPTSLILVTTLGVRQEGAFTSADIQSDALSRLAFNRELQFAVRCSTGAPTGIISEAGDDPVWSSSSTLPPDEWSATAKKFNSPRKKRSCWCSCYAHPTVPFSRDDLLQRVWGYQEAPLSRTVDTHIARLARRSKSIRETPAIFRRFTERAIPFSPNVVRGRAH